MTLSEVKMYLGLLEPIERCDRGGRPGRGLLLLVPKTLPHNYCEYEQTTKTPKDANAVCTKAHWWRAGR